MSINVDKLSRMASPQGLPFNIGKLGHVVLQVTDLERSTDFYTRILGFRIVVRLRDPLRQHDVTIDFVSIHAPPLQRGELSHIAVPIAMPMPMLIREMVTK